MYILSFVLTPDYIHMVLAPRARGGVSLYMQRLCTGYARYYNSRYDRRGKVFQGRFKAHSIDGNMQLDTLIRHIHAFPLRQWIDAEPYKASGEGEDVHELLTALCTYRWSSIRDYLGERHSHLLPPQEILRLYYPSEQREERGAMHTRALYAELVAAYEAGNLPKPNLRGL